MESSQIFLKSVKVRTLGQDRENDNVREKSLNVHYCFKNGHKMLWDAVFCNKSAQI
jgi:hypothetical protein